MSGFDGAFKVSRGAFDADMRQLVRQTDAHTLIGLRAVGRELVRAEKRLAPVYAGPKGITRKSLKEAGAKPSKGGRPVVGLLRFSTKTSRARRSGLGYRVVVGPGGGRVNLYKNKIERIYHFAQVAHDEVVPQARVIMEAAWAKALRRAA